RYLLGSLVWQPRADPITVSRGMRELGRYALARIDTNRNTLQVHRLIQKLLRDELTEDEADEIRHEVHLLLAAADPGDPEEPENWPKYHELLAHLEPSEVAKSQDSEARRLVQNVIDYLYYIGDFTTCINEIERALERRGEPGNDDR